MTPTKGDRPILEHLDKIIFGAACLYFILVMFWLTSYTQLFSNSQEQKSQKPPLSPADAQFIAYLQQSLSVIDQKSEPRTLVNPQNISSVPTPASPVQTPAPPKIIERVYVPVYPAQQSPSAPTPQPTTTASPSPSSVTSIPSPPPLPIAETKVPVLSPGGTISSLPSSVATSSAAAPTGNSGHGLVGLLESGDRSSALVTYNGITRRFSLGESIGTSGWVLMGVQNQQAVIYRNGQTRYLEVGQAF